MSRYANTPEEIDEVRGLRGYVRRYWPHGEWLEPQYVPGFADDRGKPYRGHVHCKRTPEGLNSILCNTISGTIEVQP